MTTQITGYREKNISKQEVHHLDSRAVERLPGVQTGDAIFCTGGILWVTQENDPEDYLLQKSSRFVASRQGVVVIQAFTEAEYRLSTGRLA